MLTEKELKEESTAVLWIGAIVLTPAMFLADMATDGRAILKELQRRKDRARKPEPIEGQPGGQP